MYTDTDRIILYLFGGVWILMALMKIFYPHSFVQMIQKPLVYFHSFQARAHHFFSVDKIGAHLTFMTWLVAYILITGRAWPHIPVYQTLVFALGFYLMINTGIFMARWMNKKWADLYFLQLSLNYYITVWMASLSFFVYFLPINILWRWYLITLLFFVGLIYLGWGIWKTGVNELGFKKMYIILYLCTLIILPIGVLFSYVI